MVNLGMFPDDLEKRTDQDFSDIWCHRLDKPDRHYYDVKKMLVQTLTYACEQVFTNAPESIEALVAPGWLKSLGKKFTGGVQNAEN